MELLFIWINRSDYEVYYNEGVNISPEYNFIVEKKDGKIILKEDNAWQRKESIFKSNVVQNVSAIVGKNGSGKTTLLKHIFNMECFPLQNEKKEGYEEWTKFQNEKALSVYIFKNNKGEIIVFHNAGDKFVCDEVYQIFSISNDNFTQNALRDDRGDNGIFTIYITNSSYGRYSGSNAFAKGKLDKVALTPAGINTIASSFFRRLFDLDSPVNNENDYFAYRELVMKRIPIGRFQNICDIIYYDRLLKENNFEGYSSKVSTVISVSCPDYPLVLREAFGEELEIKYGKLLDQFSCEYKNENTPNTARDYILQALINNLIFEICLELGAVFPDDINGFNKKIEWVREVLADKKNQYFNDALKEIEVFETILRDSKEQENLLPKGDLAYKWEVVFDYNDRKESYKTFLNFISERFSAEHSMILRYLEFENVGMSSGERAFQNIFSWINLLPQYNNIDRDVSKELKNNIILLIDEIDLYMHPEWQKKLMSFLLEETEKQFEGYKLQIIIATHSPLALSDIPRENTVYLTKNNEHASVDNRLKHKQSFSMDLYSILNDAFYLGNSTMGDFAKSYINDILNKMLEDNEYKSISYEEAKAIKGRIELIGDRLLRSKIETMLKNCIKKDKDVEIKLLHADKKRIEQRIEELERNNDKI